MPLHGCAVSTARVVGARHVVPAPRAVERGPRRPAYKPRSRRDGLTRGAEAPPTGVERGGRPSRPAPTAGRPGGRGGDTVCHPPRGLFSLRPLRLCGEFRKPQAGKPVPPGRLFAGRKCRASDGGRNRAKRVGCRGTTRRARSRGCRTRAETARLQAGLSAVRLERL